MHINDWRQSGKLYIWRYKGNPRNYKGWHTTADDEGCHSLISLFQLLAIASPGAKRTIALTKPSRQQFDCVGCTSKPIATEKLVVIKSDEDKYWSLIEENGRIELTIGDYDIAELINGFQDILNDDGDYCIGPDGQELWFWWEID